MPLAITAATPGLLQHGTVVLAVAHGKGASRGMPSRSARASSASPLSTPAAVTSTFFRGAPVRLHARDGAEAGQRLRHLLLGSKNRQSFSTRGRGGSSTRPRSRTHGKAAIVGLAGLGGVRFAPGAAASLRWASVMSVAVRENAQAAVGSLADGKGFPGSLHRHQACAADRWVTGRALSAHWSSGCTQHPAGRCPDPTRRHRWR